MEQNKYPAILYVGDVKTRGSVELNDRHLIFTPSEGSNPPVKWDEYSLTAAFEGDLLGLHSTLEPEKSIFVQDASFAAILSKELGIHVRSGLRHWWGRRPIRAALAMTVGLFACTILLLTFLRTQGRYFAQFVSHEQEVELGKQAMDSDWKNDVITLPPDLQAGWNKLLKKLFAQPELKTYDWNVAIVNSDVVNAFALPGGFIAVNSELIIQAETADEILGVLAHEAAHVTQRHSVQALAGELSSKILLSTLFLGGSNIMTGMLFAADGLQSLSFSRAQELEADRFGVQYMKNARLTTKGMYAFFGRKHDKDEKSNDDSLSYLSTHPMDNDRLTQIRRLDPANDGESVEFDLKPLKLLLDKEGIKRLVQDLPDEETED